MYGIKGLFFDIVCKVSRCGRREGYIDRKLVYPGYLANRISKGNFTGRKDKFEETLPNFHRAPFSPFSLVNNIPRGGG